MIKKSIVKRVTSGLQYLYLKATFICEAVNSGVSSYPPNVLGRPGIQTDRETHRQGQRKQSESQLVKQVSNWRGQVDTVFLFVETSV